MKAHRKALRAERCVRRSLLFSFVSLLSSFCFVVPSSAIPPDGYVVRVGSGTLYLDWGKPSAVQVGDRFEVYRKGETLKHPVTGEILGSADESLGSGSIQSVEEKFAVGRWEDSKKTPKVGDRTRYQGTVTPIAAAFASAVAASTTAAGVPAAPVPIEIWRSEPLDKDAVGMAFSDLDGDGQKEVIVAYRNAIQAYRINDKRLEPLVRFGSKKYGRWLAIDTADLRGTGQEELFATAYTNGLDRPRGVVLRYEKGALAAVADFEGFLRAVTRFDGRRAVLRQTLSRTLPSVTTTVSYTGVSELLWDKEKARYHPGPPLDLKLASDQLFGYAWGSWLVPGQENFAVLEHGERIRVIGPDVKWKSGEVYGGTKNDFTVGREAVGSFFPRLTRLGMGAGNKDLLVASTNYPDFGVRFKYLKMYKRSEIAALAWNGLEMKAAWKIPIEGYLADYALVEFPGDPQPQLWAAAVGPGNKTILITYRLP